MSGPLTGSAPPADLDITTQLVAALLAEQHPDLAHRPLEIVAHGWDNVIVRLGSDLAVRLPRRAPAATLVAHELASLPLLAPLLPTPVPCAVRAGTPSMRLGYPWVWAVVPWFDGVRVASLPRTARVGLAEPLAELLAALHRPAPATAPHNAFRGGPLIRRDAAVRERLAALAVPGGFLSRSGLLTPAGLPQSVDNLRTALTAIWDDGLAAQPYAGPSVWLHGDLHAANLIATAAAPHRLVAVADWGDVTAGDPATDLAVAWLVLSEEAGATFRTRLVELTHPCAADVDAWRRARAWAVTMATSMAQHADVGAEHCALAQGALARVLGTRAPSGAR
ncbi:phosphotransferase [Sanguibacter sp. A247]|uniref:phosphotransferase n=1 Tax=unclassified Sanguibacter TaxID=2645534 RepID=UPI003FD77B6E